MNKIGLFLVGLIFIPFFLKGQIIPAGPINLCEGSSQKLTVTQMSPSYKWQKNGENIPGATNDEFSVTATGEYSVIINGGGKQGDTLKAVIVTVNPKPIANFTFTNDSQCSDTDIQFTSIVSSGKAPYTYEWDFGDGTKSSSPNPKKAYEKVGEGVADFTVKLTITDANKCSVTTKEVIKVIQKADASINDYISEKAFTNCDGKTSFVLTINNSSTTQRTNTNYKIDWGDGKAPYDSNILPNGTTHTYSGLGYFNLILTVTNNFGCTSKKNYSVYNGSNPEVPFPNPGASIGKCIPFSFSIPSLANNNPPGTIYLFEKNDGTPMDTVNTIPQGYIYNHIFNKSSCGATGGKTPNTFFISIRSENQCGFSDLTIEPITTNIKPVADFSISPKKEVCTNSKVKFSNTSQAGTTVDNAGTCDNTTFINWSISPSSGWNITNGKLGDKNPTKDPMTWGSTDLEILFTKSGQYSVSIIVQNKCGNDTLTKNICVENPLTPSFTLDKTTSCTPLTVNATNKTDETTACSTIAYNWAVSYSATNCGTGTGNWEFTKGTLATSKNASFLFNTPGTYRITLTSENSCGKISTQAQEVVIKSPPKVSLPADINSCGPYSYNPIPNINDCSSTITKYEWTFSGGTPASSTSKDPGNVTFSTPGIHSISFKVTNECGTAEAKQNITINAIPAVTVPENKTVCSGEKVELLQFSANPASSISWTSTFNIGFGLNGTGSIPSFTAVNTTQSPIIATISVTATINSGTCKKTEDFTITVNPLPLKPIAPSPVSYCQNQEANPLTATATNGNSLIWYANKTDQSGNITPPTPLTSNVGTFYFYVAQKNTLTGCESESTEISVNVKAIPEILLIKKNDPTDCISNNGSIELTLPNPNTTYLINYYFEGKLISKLYTSDVNRRIFISGLPSGTYSGITASLEGCQSLNPKTETLSPPLAPAAPIATTNSPICSDGTLTLFASSVTGATYQWSGPNGFSAITQNPTVTNVQMAASGIYSVIAVKNNCKSTAGTIEVIINETPLIVISNNSPICSGNDLQLTTITTYRGTGTLTYSWSGPNGFTSSIENPIISAATTLNSGSYQLVTTAVTGNCFVKKDINVTVNETPVITATANNPLNCSQANGTIIIEGLIPNIQYTVKYTKDGQANPIVTALSSDSKGEIIVLNLAQGDYSNISVVLKNCASNVIPLLKLSDPNPPVIPIINPINPLCSGGSFKLSVTNKIQGATYNWTTPAGGTLSGPDQTINNAALSDQGQYVVKVTLNGCSSISDPGKVTIYQTPSISTSSNSPICSGSDLKLTSSTAFVGDLIYSWTGPNKFTSEDKNPIIPSSIIENGGTYNLKVTSSEGNCFSNAQIDVLVNLTPSITAKGINPKNCSIADGSISISGLVKNTTYTAKYIKDGINYGPVSINANTNGDASIPLLGQGVYTNIVVFSNGCSSNPVSVTLSDPNPPAIFSITNNGPLCVGSDLILSAKADAGVTYSWSGPNGFGSKQKDATKTNIQLGDAGKYILTIEKDKCFSSEETELIINALPASPRVFDVEYCIGAVAVPLTANAWEGGSLIWFIDGNGGTGSSSAPTPSTAIAGTIKYYVAQTDGKKCESKRAEIVATIHPDAIAQFNPTKLIDCPPFSISASDIGLKEYPLNNGTYEWYAAAASIGSGAEFPGYTISKEEQSVEIKLKATSLFGCKSDEISKIFSTNILPHPDFDLINNEGCGPLKVSITNKTPDINSFNYYWDFGNQTNSTLAEPGDIIFLPDPNAGDITYVIQLKASNECKTEVFEKEVHVSSKPKALFTPSKTEGCSPMKITFSNTTRGKNATYLWDFGDGTTYSTSIAEDVEHTFNAGNPTTFTVSLTATNECGTDVSEFKVVVAPNPIKLKFAMNGPDHFGCGPHTVILFNNTAGASSFYWDFGDGNFLSSTKGVEEITHTYLIPGDYKITVQASSNCTDTTAFDYVHVYPKPKAAFTPDRYTLCIGDKISFSNQSQLATSYLWDFGDGITSTLSEPTHIYKTPGLYPVKLTVFKLNSPGSVCSETTEQQINISEIMEGSFIMSDTNGNCAPSTVSFENEIKSATVINWDFGDGTNGTGNQIQHTYLVSGTYTATLTVIVPGGCTYKTTKTVQINGPSGTFEYTPGYNCTSSSVRFATNSTSSDTYLWNFGDGTSETTTGETIYHTYNKPGKYFPTLTLTKSGGCNFLLKGPEAILIDHIDAGYQSNEEAICGSTTLRFSDTSHVFFGKNEILWDFGDGNTGTGSNQNHTYTSSGNYITTMTITGISGCEKVIQKENKVHVKNIPIADIIADSKECTNKPVLFQANIQSEDPINITKWELSNGATGNNEIFNCSFSTPGNYTIKLNVITLNGCTNTKTQNILINPSPSIKASADLTLCLGRSAKLNVSGASAYQWSPLENISCTSCTSPIANPIITTPYIVEGFNNYGCSDVDTVVVTVIQPMHLSSSGNDSICIGQSINLMVSGAATYIWSPNEGLNNNTISNPTANPGVTTTYRVVGSDGYNCFTDTAFIVVGVGDYPKIDIGPDQILSTGTIFPLKSNVTNGPIKNWLWSPTTDLDCASCATPNAYIKNSISYTVEATNIYGCKGTDSIHIKVFCESTQVFIPNAFSPDGDGINDILMVRGKGIVTVKSFRIFNRWGELVFERSNFPPNDPTYGWDGKVRGKAESTAVYVYTAEIVCENGVSFIYKGNTTIIK